MLFALTVDWALSPSYEKWKTEATGLKFWTASLEVWDITADKTNTSLEELTFADDMTLVSDTPAKLQSIIADIAEALKGIGLCLSLEKCVWMSTNPQDLWETIMIDGVELEFTWTMTLLGCNISSEFDDMSEVNFRILKGWKYFWCHKQLFCNRHARLSKRLHVWSFTVKKSVMWGLETMALTEKQLQLLDTMQTYMVIHMIRVRRNTTIGETWVEWAQRRVRTARYFIERYTPGHLNVEYLLKYWRWAGHLARLPQSRSAFQCTRYMCLQWKNEGMSSDQGRPIYDKDHQWKIRPGNTYGVVWERRLHDFCTSQNGVWWYWAQDRKMWEKMAWNFAITYQLPVRDWNFSAVDVDGQNAALQVVPWTGEAIWFQPGDNPQ